MGSGITKHCMIDLNCFSYKNDTNKRRKIWFIPFSFNSFSGDESVHKHPPGIRGESKKVLWTNN